MKKKLFIPVFLAALAVPLCLQQRAEGLNASFIGITNQTDYLSHGVEVNGQLADEGFVLLKNEDGFLPLSGDEKISIVGKSSTNLVLGGSGSGSGSVSSGVQAVNLQKSLTDVGFKINDELTKFYNNDRNSGYNSGNGRTNGNSGWQGDSEVTIGETPMSSYPEKVLKTMEEDYNDLAIMVISREGSEGCDVKTCNAHDSIKTNNSYEAVSHKHALELSDNEEALLAYLEETCNDIIV